MKETIAPLKAADVLGEELPLTAYWDSFVSFSVYAVPLLLISFGALVALIELMKRGAPEWVLLLLFVLAAALLMVVAFSYFAWQQQVTYYDHLKHTRFQVQMVLSFAMQNSITGSVEVKGRGNTVTLNQGQVVEQSAPDVAGGQMYEVALRIAETAIRSWNLHNGKRETPKPFSARAIGDALGVGGETWQDATALLDRAGVTQNAAHATQWKVIINNQKQAEDALFRAMIASGYVSFKQNGQQFWYRADRPALQSG